MSNLGGINLDDLAGPFSAGEARSMVGDAGDNLGEVPDEGPGFSEDGRTRAEEFLEAAGREAFSRVLRDLEATLRDPNWEREDCGAKVSEFDDDDEAEAEDLINSDGIVSSARTEPMRRSVKKSSGRDIGLARAMAREKSAKKREDVALDSASEGVRKVERDTVVRSGIIKSAFVDSNENPPTLPVYGMKGRESSERQPDVQVGAVSMPQMVAAPRLDLSFTAFARFVKVLVSSFRSRR